jgi:hypothetical protein
MGLRDFKIYHNTVILNGVFLFGAIEYRFAVSQGEIRYNLTDAPIWRRDDAEVISIREQGVELIEWFEGKISDPALLENSFRRRM